MNKKELQYNWKIKGVTIEIKQELFENFKKSVPTKSGLYRIKTNCPTEILKKVTNRKDKKHYDFKNKIIEVSKIPNKHIIKQSSFRSRYCIYNGHTKNLRQRFNEHFKGTKGTGCLAIFELEYLKNYDWYFNYLNLESIEDYTDSKVYRTYLEQLDRYTLGWPILCSQ